MSNEKTTMIATLIEANKPRADGTVFTKECLEGMASQNPFLVFDHEANALLCNAEIAPEFIDGQMVGASFVSKSAVSLGKCNSDEKNAELKIEGLLTEYAKLILVVYRDKTIDPDAIETAMSAMDIQEIYQSQLTKQSAEIEQLRGLVEVSITVMRKLLKGRPDEKRGLKTVANLEATLKDGD